MPKDNSNPVYTRVGVIMLFLGVLLFIIDSKTGNNLYLGRFSSILFFVGIILMAYGMTKIEVKEDKSYQKFLRIDSKISLVFIILFLILGVIGSIFHFSLPFIIIIFVLFGIFVIWLIISMLIFYIKTYKYMKKVNSKLTSKEKIKQLILLIICVILGLAMWYFYKYY